VSTDRLKVLEEQLGAAAPERLKELTDEQLRDLAEAISEARHRQAAELAAAGDQAVRHIPKLLRLALRKVLG
jgi:hypothetical protein